MHEYNQIMQIDVLQLQRQCKWRKREHKGHKGHSGVESGYWEYTLSVSEVPNSREGDVLESGGMCF